MKIYHSPLFYANLVFLLFFLKALSSFAQAASARNDGSLILVLLLFFAGALGIACGLLIDYGIRNLISSQTVSWGLQVVAAILIGTGWYKGILLLSQ